MMRYVDWVRVDDPDRELTDREKYMEEILRMNPWVDEKSLAQLSTTQLFKLVNGRLY